MLEKLKNNNSKEKDEAKKQLTQAMENHESTSKIIEIPFDPATNTDSEYPEYLCCICQKILPSRNKG
jgi:hypothetical protein